MYTLYSLDLIADNIQLQHPAVRPARLTYVHKSNIGHDLLEDEAKLQCANATGWNSQVTMIKSVLRVPKEKLDNNKLSAYERNCLMDICDILQPFQVATDMVQGEKIVNSSFVIPCVRGFERNCAQCPANLTTKLVKTLPESVNPRLSVFEQRQLYVLAAALDPRFNLKWCCDGSERAQITDVLTHSVVSLTPAPHQQSEDSNPPPAKRHKSDDLLDFVEDSGDNNTRVENPTWKSQSTSASHVWIVSLTLSNTGIQRNNFPTIVRLAATYLSIPASSAPVESLFSVAGKDFRPERCGLKGMTFEQLMFIRCNSNVLVV